MKRAMEDGVSPELIVFLKASEEATCDDCSFTFLAYGEASRSPIVSSISGEISGEDIIITIDGERFDTEGTSGVELLVGTEKAILDSVSSEQAVFTVDNLVYNSDLVNSLKMYTTVGKPEAHALVDGGVGALISFNSISPDTASTGGSLITAKVIGVGTGDEVLFRTSRNGEICETTEVLSKNEVRCQMIPL